MLLESHAVAAHCQVLHMRSLTSSEICRNRVWLSSKYRAAIPTRACPIRVDTALTRSINVVANVRRPEWLEASGKPAAMNGRSKSMVCPPSPLARKFLISKDRGECERSRFSLTSMTRPLRLAQDIEAPCLLSTKTGNSSAFRKEVATSRVTSRVKLSLLKFRSKTKATQSLRGTDEGIS